MLKLLGFLIGLIIALLPFAAIVYAFGGKEKLDQYLLNQFIKKSLAEKVEMIMKKDSSPKYADATFYLGNNYRKRHSQREWLDYCRERVDPSLDKDSQEYAEAVAPLVNAIVINRYGFYLRRGMEDLGRSFQRFLPGVNDRISLNYFVEPYKYSKNEELAAKSLKEEALRQEEYERDRPLREAREAERKAAQQQRLQEQRAHREEKAALFEQQRQERQAAQAARARCSQCVNSAKCSIQTKSTPGACGGYMPRQ